MNYEILTYETETGKIPFDEWLDDLDVTQVALIARRIDRFRKGNFGDHEAVGQGVYEARMHEGPGYRVYYSVVGKAVVLLLCGGTKRRQAKDITKAHKYLEDYKLEKEKYGKKMG